MMVHNYNKNNFQFLNFLFTGEKQIADLLKTTREQNNQILGWIRKQDSVRKTTYCALPDDMGVDLPLKSEQDLQQLEEYIADKNNFLALVCILIWSILMC